MACIQLIISGFLLCKTNVQLDCHSETIRTLIDELLDQKKKKKREEEVD
jgi:hypothetical protein